MVSLRETPKGRADLRAPRVPHSSQKQRTFFISSRLLMAELELDAAA